MKTDFLQKKKMIWIAVTAAAVIMILILSRQKPVPVKVLKIERGEFRVIVNATTTSTVRSEFDVTLSAQRTGRITHLPVKEGDRVKAGARIAQLDLTEESVQSESVLAQSQATYAEAEKNLARMKDLFEKGMIAQQDLDAQRRVYEVAKSQHEAAAKDVKVRRDYSVIRAPFSGVIANKFTEVGELLLPGKGIVTIVDPEHIYVLSTIDEVDVGRLRIGQSVTITVDAFPEEKFEGTVKRVSPVVTGGKLETRTADVWIYFSKKQPRIKPGMSADVEILANVIPAVLYVPTQAIIMRAGKKQVYVLEKKKTVTSDDTAKASLRPVKEGEINWNFTEIRDGLSEGQYVVTTPGAEGLKDGATVRIEGGQ